jgi:hypothetical protein
MYLDAVEGIKEGVSSEIILSYVRAGNGKQVVELGKECGSKKFVIACPDHHEEKEFFMNHCSRLQCPICLRHTTARLAKDIVDRMNGLIKCMHREHIRTGFLKHITFSLPPDMFSKKDFEEDGGKKIWKQFYKMIRSIAKNEFYGGVAFLHGERGSNDVGWHWSPHIHFLGYGFFESSESVIERTGWLYRIFKDNGKRNVFTTVMYELNHTALFLDGNGKQRNQVVRWIGFLSNSKGGKKVTKVIEYRLCPKCKMPMHRFGISDQDDGVNWNYDQGEITERSEKIEWYLNKKQKLKKEDMDLNKYV